MSDIKNEQEQIWSQLDQMLPTGENDSKKADKEFPVQDAVTHSAGQLSQSAIVSSTDTEALSQNQHDQQQTESSSKPPVQDCATDNKELLDDKSTLKKTSNEDNDDITEKTDGATIEEKFPDKKTNEPGNQVNHNALQSKEKEHTPSPIRSIPESGGYAKPIKYRPSIKAFYPHLSILLISAFIFMFPSIATSLFSSDDLEKLPSFVHENLVLIVKGSVLFICALIIFVVFRQKTSGLINVFGDHLEFKKGLISKTTVHFADIRTIEVRRCLASAYTSIGDFHIITSKHHLVLQNLYEPFALKEAIMKRKADLKI